MRLRDGIQLWFSTGILSGCRSSAGFSSGAGLRSPEQPRQRRWHFSWCEQQQPDVIVFEPEACTSGTARFLEAARAAGPQLRAVAVSTIDDPDAIRAVLRAGAWAYVLKSAEPDDIAVAVRQAFVHSIHLTRTLEPADPARGSSPRSLDGPAVSVLTRREREILALVAEGHSNSAMARRLWVTEQTVKFHLSNIYRKLDVPNRTAATRWAHEHGLIGEAPAGGLEVLAAG